MTLLNADPLKSDSNKLRILFVTHAFPRFIDDNAGAFLFRLAKSLSDMGCIVKIIAPSSNKIKTTELHGISVDRFRYAPAAWETLAYTGTMAEQVQMKLSSKLAFLGLIISGSRCIKRNIKEFKPDLVHAHWWIPSGISSFLASKRCPFIITLHGSDLRHMLASQIIPRIFSIIIKRASAVTAVSSWLAEQAMSIEPSVKVPILSMPVDTKLFNLGQYPRCASLLFVGRLNEQKGVADLLHAMSQLPESLSLDVVGDGIDADIVKRLATELNLTKRIRWHGQINQVELVRLYQMSSLLMLPARDEGMGLVAVEALLCGTPVVAYHSGGISDIVEDGLTGYLVQAGNTSSLINSILKLMENPTLLEQMGREGHKKMQKRFSESKIAKDYFSFYNQVLSK